LRSTGLVGAEVPVRKQVAEIHSAAGCGKDVFVHISAVERAGLSTLNEGQNIEYEIEENRAKTSAVDLKVK
jgi:cold shock CspA family protein